MGTFFFEVHLFVMCLAVVFFNFCMQNKTYIFIFATNIGAESQKIFSMLKLKKISVVFIIYKKN